MLILTKQNAQSVAAASFGNKAVGLAALKSAGVSIPLTALISRGEQVTDTHIELLCASLGTTSNGDLIVRSSSGSEDTSTTSNAGVFKSVRSSVRGIKESSEIVRNHALSVAGLAEIPLVIQPALEGPGGVYLADRARNTEYVSISWLGPEDVTAGLVSIWTKVPEHTALWISAVETCRNTANKFLHAIDMEFVWYNERVIFLQLRPWVSADRMQTQTSVATHNDNSLTEYFPRRLQALIGDLWVAALSVQPSKFSVECVNGELRIVSSIDDDGPSEFSDEQLKAAVSYYRDRLFPSWRETESELSVLLDSSAVIDMPIWNTIYRAWLRFYDQYLYNEFEPVINWARQMAPPGGGISDELRRYFVACQKIGAVVRDDVIAARASPVVEQWIEQFGYMFNDCHYFDEPTASEDNTVLINLAADIAGDFRSQEGVPQLTTVAARLAIDDNFHKHKFNSLLRRAILGVASAIGSNSYDIWRFSLGEFEAALLSGKLDKPCPSSREASGEVTSVLQKKSPPRVLNSVPLTKGDGEGRVRTTPSPNERDYVLTVRALTPTDYGRLTNASGIIVAVGTQTSHGILLAAELGKAVHMCPLALSVLADGSHIRLDERNKTISVISDAK